ncbi:hypothetical protein DFH06DRAFT_1400124 [Mycena polygramma]|nr:hypothetical protein DFH06DRAFT_1400124 [Mycena polygramma]
MSSATTTIPELLSQPRRQVYLIPSSIQLNSANFWRVARLPQLLSPHLSLVVWGQGEPLALRVELHVDYRETHRVVFGRFDVANTNLKQRWCIGDTTWSLMMVVNEAIGALRTAAGDIYGPQTTRLLLKPSATLSKLNHRQRIRIFQHTCFPDVVELDYEDTWGNRYVTPLPRPSPVIFDPDQAHAERSPSWWTGPIFCWAWAFETERAFRTSPARLT